MNGKRNAGRSTGTERAPAAARYCRTLHERGEFVFGPRPRPEPEIPILGAWAKSEAW